MKTVVLTDRPAGASDPIEVQAINSLMGDLIERATVGRFDIGLNALLGAYFNLAVRDGNAARAAKVLILAADAANRIAAGATGAAVVAPTADDAQVEQAKAATVSLSNRVQAVLVGEPHHLALSALLDLFIQGATDNSCCTEACAKAAAEAGQLLAERAEGLGGSATVH